MKCESFVYCTLRLTIFNKVEISPFFCALPPFLNDSNIDFKGDAFRRLFRLITEANNCLNINTQVIS